MGRTRPIRLIVALAMLAWVAVVLAGCDGKTPANPQVVINGRSWFVDLARTPQEQAQGLAGRQHLPEDVGMLFIFEKPSELVFCMRGCDIPIDVAFISADLRVVSIHTMAVEPDRAGRVGYRSGQDAVYALEVAGGGLTRAGVHVGDHVQFVSIPTQN